MSIVKRIKKNIIKNSLIDAKQTDVKGLQGSSSDKPSICSNSECVMRKRARCSGFEACPGFKSK